MADDTYLVSLPDGVRGCWCRLLLQLPTAPVDAVIQVDAIVDDQQTGSIPLTTLVLGDRDRCSGLAFFPPEAAAIRLRLFANSQPYNSVELSYARLTRSAAAFAIASCHARRLMRIALRGLLTNPRDVAGRLRIEFSHLAAAEPSPPYTLWTRLFDSWTAADAQRLSQTPRRNSWPEIETIVVSHDPAMPLMSEVLSRGVSEYVAVLQAGEVLPPHALPLLADYVARLNRPAMLYADEDRIGADGIRYDPLFKSPPSRMLMLSGTLSTGVWLIRRDHLKQFSPGSELWAETLRLDAWLRLQEAGGAAASYRVPFVLTHRGPDTKLAPATALAAVVEAHIARTGLPARVTIDRPLRITLAAPPSAQRRISIVVPSACRTPHVLHYLSETLAKTDYADFELVIVVAGNLPLDADQESMLAKLETDRRVRRLVLQMEQFNYATVNNCAVAATDSPLVCLLNDDVAPRNPGWLAAMVGHLADPTVGIVGARLYYPDHTVQHAGILLRPGGTGEHMHRFLPEGEPGYGWRARLSQEVSAVTGACLVTRRDLWDELGGLDENYASAFNDVDFCLRAREAGYRVVLAAEAELTHAESASFGRHYAADESVRSHADRARMRGRFPQAFAADPFYNPNLSLRLGDFGSLAFPPLVSKSTIIDGCSRSQDASCRGRATEAE